MYTNRTAIMATGGIDSTVLLYKIAQDTSREPPIVLTVDYGQKAFGKQLELLQWHCNHLMIYSPVVIPLSFEPWQTRSGLFTSNYKPQEENPLEDWNKLRYEDFFIEGRNLLMVAMCMAYCSAHGIEELLAGYLYGEEEWKHLRSYKLMTGDNSPHFVDMINLMSQFGFSHSVRFRAPFYENRNDKREVIQIGDRLGVDFDKTYSCYFVPECGVCDNCLLREQLLKQ